MKFNLLMILCSCALIFSSCKNDSSGSSNGTLKTTAGGHQYYELKAGTGTPGSPGDVIIFNVAQYMDDSLLIDSRASGQPARFEIIEPGSRPTQSVEEILMGLSPGDSVKISMGMDTMKQKPPGMTGEFYNIFVAVESIQTKAEIEAEEAEQEKLRAVVKAREAEVGSTTEALIKQYGAGSLGASLLTAPSGIKYVLHEPGSGEHPQPGERVKVHYYGALTDGSMFDNSFGRGDAFEFVLGQGQVIKGWDEGIPLLKPGGSATLFIPYEMAYGEAGRPPQIPAKAELVFYVELMGSN